MNRLQNKIMGKGARRGVMLGALAFCVVFSGFLMVSLNADNLQGASYVLKFSPAEIPVRGESGWINLPYTRGIVRVNDQAGAGFMKVLTDLREKLGVTNLKSTGGSTFVLEGTEGYLLHNAVTEGVPSINFSCFNNNNWQALAQGGFKATFDPYLINPETNSIGVLLPKAFIGALTRVRAEGIPDHYGVVDDCHLGLSWKAMAILANNGVSEATIEIISTAGLSLNLTFSVETVSGEMSVRFGL